MNPGEKSGQLIHMPLATAEEMVKGIQDQMDAVSDEKRSGVFKAIREVREKKT